MIVKQEQGQEIIILDDTDDDEEEQEEEDDQASQEEPPIDENNLIAVPTNQTKKCRFPPGCLVLMGKQLHQQHVRYRYGQVEQIFINFASSNREDLYRVREANSDSSSELFWKESQVQFAPRCPVWLSVPSSSTPKAAVVLGSEFYSADPEEQLEATFLHSVQVVTDTQRMYHGVVPHQLQYRWEEQEHNNLQQKHAKIKPETDVKLE